MHTTSHDPSHFTRAVTDFGGQHTVVTTRPIMNVHGTKVLEQGVTVEPSLYDRLMQHHLSAPLEEAVTSIPRMTPAMLQAQVAQAVERVPLYERMVADHDDRALLLESVARIPLPEPIAFQLTLACEMRPQLFSHLIDSALVAAWLAMDPAHASHARVVHAASAGLLHDIGMLHLDPVLLDYRQGIDEALQRELYTHPVVAHVLAQNQHSYPAEVLEGILDHHEFLDGSGYPRALSGEALGPVARILGLTELIVGAYAPGRMVSEQRLSIVLRMNMHRYDEALAQRVLALLQPYPEIIGSELPLLGKPVATLRSIQRTLELWPYLPPHATAPSTHHPDGVDFIGEQVLRLQHNLARVGAAPAQLEQLESLQDDFVLRHELTLLVDEAAWQLRALARQIHQRWHGGPDHALPPALERWLGSVEHTVDNIHAERGASAGVDLPN